jgi:hypothetical protein
MPFSSSLFSRWLSNFAVLKALKPEQVILQRDPPKQA